MILKHISEEQCPSCGAETASDHRYAANDERRTFCCNGSIRVTPKGERFVDCPRSSEALTKIARRQAFARTLIKHIRAGDVDRETKHALLNELRSRAWTTFDIDLADDLITYEQIKEIS